MQDLTVAIIQDALHWQQAGANRAQFADRLDALVAAHKDTAIDVAVLPEMFTTGFTMNAADVAEPMDGASLDWMRAQAARHNLVLTGSVVITEGSHFFNRLLWVLPDGTVRSYDKRHLFRMAGEHEVYEAGTSQVVIEHKGWRVAPFICYDLRFPVWSRRRAGQGFDYDVALYVANWPAPRHDAWHTLLRARAMENQSYVVGVNRIGRDGNDIEYPGGSAVLDFLGRDLANCHGELTAAVATLSGDGLRQARERFPLWRDADDFVLE
ncbi:MAG: amidohydrolase [Pseudomonadota bacterium]